MGLPVRLLDGLEPFRAGDLLEEGLRLPGDEVGKHLKEGAYMRATEMAVQALPVLPVLDEAEGVRILHVLVEALADAAGLRARGRQHVLLYSPVELFSFPGPGNEA